MPRRLFKPIKDCKKCGERRYIDNFASKRSRHCCWCKKLAQLYKSFEGRLIYSWNDTYRRLPLAGTIGERDFWEWGLPEIQRFYDRWPNESPSLDRIDASLSYLKGNLRIIPK